MNSHEMFDEAHAASYDDRFIKLAAWRDALHLTVQLALADLPGDARILCVGAGTGAELLHLAGVFPGWRFTAVDPSAPMLARCRARAQAAGIASRCVFHEGPADTLPTDAGFDGATALLVSQFLVDSDARRDFFRAIAERLRPAAPLVVADLAASAVGDGHWALWKRAWLHADVPAENIARMADMVGRHVAVLPPEQVASIIASGGFDAPYPCFQTVLIHGWLAHRSAIAPG